MTEYLHKVLCVSSACKLTCEEDILLLRLCAFSTRSRISFKLMNRKAFISTLSSLSVILSDKKWLQGFLNYETNQIWELWSKSRLTVLKNQKKSMITSRLVGSASSRPEEKDIVLWCIKLLEFISSGLNSIIEVTGG